MSTAAHKITFCSARNQAVSAAASLVAATFLGTLGFLIAAASQAAPVTAGPTAIAPITPIAPPKDRPYAGEIELKVDATDTGIASCAFMKP